MSALQITLALCAILALFGTSHAASTKPLMAERRNSTAEDFEAVLHNVESSFAELYKILALTGDILILIPTKGTRLVGLEAVTLVHTVKNAFNDIGAATQDIADLMERLVIHDVLYRGTESVLYIIRTVRKTLQLVKRYMEKV